MKLRRVTVSVLLDEGQQRVLARQVARMHASLPGAGWNEEKELQTLISISLADMAAEEMRQQDVARELAELGLQRSDFQPFPVVHVPAWLQELEQAALGELGQQCGQCGRVHDVIGRLTGDQILCSCGAQLRVTHQPRIIKKEGGQQ